MPPERANAEPLIPRVETVVMLGLRMELANDHDAVIEAAMRRMINTDPDYGQQCMILAEDLSNGDLGKKADILTGFALASDAFYRQAVEQRTRTVEIVQTGPERTRKFGSVIRTLTRRGKSGGENPIAA